MHGDRHGAGRGLVAVLLAPRQRGIAPTRTLGAQFPTLRVCWGSDLPADDRARVLARHLVDVAAWRRGIDAWVFDRQLDDLAGRGPFALVVAGQHPIEVSTQALSVLTRAQRLVDRRNAASRAGWFERLLTSHRALHDVEKPLVRADYDHALDAWQWTLRLSPGASAASQAAALTHDIERLATEAEARIEQHAPDYAAFKAAHAQAGARMARELVTAAGAPEEVVAEVARLVGRHESPGRDAALELLNDADALSFFSLNSPGFLGYYGAEHTRRKVAVSLRRMSPRARALLSSVRLPTEIAGMVRDHRAAPVAELRR